MKRVKHEVCNKVWKLSSLARREPSRRAGQRMVCSVGKLAKAMEQWMLFCRRTRNPAKEAARIYKTKVWVVTDVSDDIVTVNRNTDKMDRESSYHVIPEILQTGWLPIRNTLRRHGVTLCDRRG